MKGRIHKAVLLAASSMAVQALAAAPALAQAAAGTSQGGLEEIVVMARKRAESVQDVPVNVAAISAATIEKQDLTSIEKIASRTPNLNVGRASNGSGAQLTMRGIGSSSTSIGIEQSVAVVVDGVYYGQGRIINEGFFDLAGAEILKGPQALFYGKNATAGVISLKTADPTDDWMVKARAGYEIKAEQAQLEAILSGPIGENLGLRVAVRGSKMWGGYYRNEQTVRPIFYGGNFFNSQPVGKGPGGKEMLGRITLQWKPSDRMTATFKVSAAENKVDSSSWNYVGYECAKPDGTLQILPEYSCSKDKFVTHQGKLPVEVAAVTPYAKKNGDLYNRYRSITATSNIVYDLDDVNLTWVTNYNWNNNRWTCACDYQTNLFGVHATENSSFKAFSSEFRALTSFDGPVNLMLGAYYQKTKRKFDQWVSFGISDNGPAAGQNRYMDAWKNSATDGETIAGFGQVTWQLMPKLEVAAGVRYSHETKDSYFVQAFVSPAFSTLWAPNRTTYGDQTFSNWSPEATISWKPTDDVLVYGAYKTAYKSGGFSNGGIDSLSPGANPAVDLLFNQEKAVGFEGGIKTEFFDRQLRVNLGAYTYAYKNLQVDFFNSTIIAFQTLTADARTKGVELEFEYAPRSIAGLNLRGSVNWNKARYTKFPAAPCYGGQTPAEGCNLIADAVSGLYRPITGAEVGVRQSLTGAPLSVAPKWVGSLGVSYDTTVGSNLVAGLSVDTRFSSSYLVSGFGAEHSRQAKYGMIDASVRVGSADERWELAVIGKNLTNRLYVSGVVDGPNTGVGTGTPGGLHADQQGFGNVPRTVMFQVTTKF
jgi:outer membrane receptor protein involved in Fe transport